MPLFEGSIRDLDRLIALLREFYHYEVVALLANEDFRYQWLPIDNYRGFVSSPRPRAAWESYVSIKPLLIPSISEFLRISPNFELELPKPESRRIALFGVRPCDAVAMNIMDKVLMNRDPQYSLLRERISVVIVEECLEPHHYCFCSDTRSGPYAREGFDIAYAIVGNRVVFRCGSPTGEEIVSRLGLEEANPELVKEYTERMRDAEKRASIGIDTNTLSKSLANAMGDEELWRRLSNLCVGCSNCNMVCPTCFCTEFITEVELDGSAKIVRKWFGCLSYAYGAVAGGHFRPRLFMRFRHFVLHKFLFYPRQVGRVGCVGCGRCIAWCPAGIDLREVLREVQSLG